MDLNLNTHVQIVYLYLNKSHSAEVYIAGRGLEPQADVNLNTHVQSSVLVPEHTCSK